jgi:hypothetical protein
MKKNPINSYSAHQEILMVLPWYVNKTLCDTEMKAVENHLKVCLTCKREMATLQKLSLAVNRADTLEAAARVSFSRIKKRIHQTEKPALALSPQKTARLHRRKWCQLLGIDLQSVALTFAVLMLAMLIPGYFVADKMLKSEFRTLSSGENTLVDRNEIKAVFREGISPQQIQKVLDSVQGQIVDGPTSEGIYLIRIPKKPEPEALLNTVLSLRKNANVIFAEPAYTLLSSSQRGGASK